MIRKIWNAKTKVLLLASFPLLVSCIGTAADLKHFDPSIFGKSVNSNIRLLLDEPGDIEPSLIQVDVKNGKFYAATVKYSTKMTLDEARRSLNKLYHRWQKPNFANEPMMGLWRNEEKGFSIQLTRDKNEIVIIYISRVVDKP
jgi:hypothetical protein